MIRELRRFIRQQVIAVPILVAFLLMVGILTPVLAFSDIGGNIQPTGVVLPPALPRYPVEVAMEYPQPNQVGNSTLEHVFYGSATYMGQPVPVGFMIFAYDPDGVRCGQADIKTAGQYNGIMVHGDDPLTPRDEGAVEGDLISFRVSNILAGTSVTPAWNSTVLLTQMDLAADEGSFVRWNATTYEMTVAGERIEVGTDTSSKLYRWGEECSLTVKPAGDIEEEVEVEVDEGKVKLKYKLKQGEHEVELESEFYSLPPSGDYEWALEHNMVWVDQPISNEFRTAYVADGLSLHHQPALTEEHTDGWSEEFEANITVTETQVYDSDTFETYVSRPENVVNSIAVYRTAGGGYARGGVNYMAGKAYHNYRGEATDSDGWTVWVDKFLDGGEIVSVVPYDFWLNANYPVSHAIGDAFGRQDVGTTTYAGSPDRVLGITNYAPSSAGTVQNITFYLQSGSYDDGPAELGLYRQSDSGFIIETATFSGETPNTWITKDVLTPTEITAQNYMPCHYGEEYSFRYDSVADSGVRDSDAFPGPWDDPGVFTLTVYHISIYAEYDPEAAPEAAQTTGYSY